MEGKVKDYVNTVPGNVAEA